MVPQTFLHILALFLVLTVQVSAQNFSCVYYVNTLQSCVDCIYPIVTDYLCTYLNECHANLCDETYASWYNLVVQDCEYLYGDADKVLHAKCKAASGPKTHAGAIAGGVVGGLAGVAAVGVIAVVAYHMLFSAIPALAHLGIAGAGAGAAGAATGASQGASSAAKGAAAGHAAHAAHAAHTGHAADAHHAATAGQASTQGGTQMAQHGAGVTSAGHNLGTGSVPYTSDSGVGHAIGQAQAPIGTDGGSTMSGGQSFSPSQSFGPAHGYGPGSPVQGVSPDFTGSGASGQGYFGPNLPPVGSDGGAGQAAAGSGYTPTTASIPTPSSSAPFSGTPFGPPNTPHFERTRWSIFGRSRKSIQDEENQRLASQSQMVQMPTLPSFPGSPLSTAAGFSPQPAIIVGNPQVPLQPSSSANFSPQPAIVVGGPQVPLQPSSTPIGVPLQTSIQYTAAQPRFPSDNKYGA